MSAQLVARGAQRDLAQRAFHHLAEVERAQARHLAARALEKSLHRGAGVRSRDARAGCLQIEHGARRADEEVAGDQRFANAVALRALRGGVRAHGPAATHQRRRDLRRLAARIVEQPHEFIGAELLLVQAPRERLLESGGFAPLRLEPEVLAEALEQRLLDLGERGHAAQHLGERDHAPARIVEIAPRELVDRHLQHLDHARRIEVDEQRPLEEERRAVDQAAGAADLPAVHLDIVARTELGRHAQPLQPRGRRAADARRDCAQVGAQAAALERKLPADLALVEIQAAAAGDAPSRPRCPARGSSRGAPRG